MKGKIKYKKGEIMLIIMIKCVCVCVWIVFAVRIGYVDKFLRKW